MVAIVSSYAVSVLLVSLVICSALDHYRRHRRSDWWQSEADKIIKRYGV